MKATLASQDVNICLIPESPYCIYGKHGLFNYVLKRLEKRGHCVIVIAEGADDSIKDLEARKDLGKDEDLHD